VTGNGTATQVGDRWHLWHNFGESRVEGSRRAQPLLGQGRTTATGRQARPDHPRALAADPRSARQGRRPAGMPPPPQPGPNTVRRYARVPEAERLQRAPQYRPTLRRPLPRPPSRPARRQPPPSPSCTCSTRSKPSATRAVSTSSTATSPKYGWKPTACPSPHAAWPGSCSPARQPQSRASPLAGRPHRRLP
jgi:hypothetical protein